MEISLELANARLTAVVDWLMLGSSPAYAEIYDGVQPAFGADPGKSPLVAVSFKEPIGTITDAVLDITPTDEYMITTSGVPTWARIKNGAGTHGWDCAVSDLTGTSPLKLSSTTLYAGGYARIVSGTLV